MSPTESVISRIGSDLFALMVPGAYVLASLGITGITGVSTVTEPTQDPFASVLAINSVVSSQWPSALALAALAYLIGQVIHAFPVNRADKICRVLLKGFMKNPWSVELYKERFPYTALLRLIFDHLKTTHPSVPVMELPTEAPPLHTVFNYWKLTVCREEPNLFVIAQHRESRVRLYAGMFWSGLLGLILASVSLGMCSAFAAPAGWTTLLWVQVGASTVLACMFGYHLRRVRGQEVETVFLSYLQVLEKRLHSVDVENGATSAHRNASHYVCNA